jgi:RNA-directed DNA polymerase
MKGRRAKSHLTLKEEKTRRVPFSIPVHHQGDKPGMFEFLGLTFYGGQSPQGTAIPKVKTSGRRLRGKLKRVNQWARSVRDPYPLKLIGARFRAKLEGHNRNSGVSFNHRALRTFSLAKQGGYCLSTSTAVARVSHSPGEQFVRFMEVHPLPAVRTYHTLF